MKLHQNTREIERGGIRVEREATIVADAVAFKVLSDMLYPDKPLAIIRELMCNAYDSHTAAGRPDIPVHLHLPNALEPYLSIRDFGLGLSFRDACILMLTYFKSTKRDSNDVTGALGLGSKTPFSYVDSYTVTTWYNRRKFVFNAFINERGNPSMALLSRERTTESNGVEIMMPVRRSDYHLFVDRAQTVLEWFRVKPVVTGYKDFKPNSREYEMEGTNWKVARVNHYRYNHNSYQPYAIQGNIAYPIDVRSMPDLPPGYADLLRQPLFLTFPIGSISFTAGRDAISYDKATVANIIAALDTVCKEVPERSQARFTNCKTMWEARCEYAALLGDSSSSELLRIMNNHKRLKFTWNGQEVVSSTATISMKDFTDPIVTALWANSSKSNRYIGKNDVNITAAKGTVFYIDDLPKGAITRLRSYRFQNQPNHDLYLLTTDTTDVAEKRKVIDEMLVQLGNPKFELASTLPAKKRSSGSTMGRKTGRIVEVSEVYGRGRDSFKENVDDIDMDDGGFYVPIYRGVAQHNSGQVQNFFSIIRKAVDLGLLAKSDTVIGVNPSQMTKFVGKEQWVNVMDHIKEKFIEKAKDSVLLNNLATEREYENVQYGQPYRLVPCWVKGEAERVLGADHAVTKFAEAFQKQQRTKRDTSLDDLKSMSSWLNLTVDQTGGTPVFAFSKEWATLMKTYPMFEALSYPDSSNGRRFVEYVQQVDMAQKYMEEQAAPKKSKVVKLEIAN